MDTSLIAPLLASMTRMEPDVTYDMYSEVAGTAMLNSAELGEYVTYDDAHRACLAAYLRGRLDAFTPNNGPTFTDGVSLAHTIIVGFFDPLNLVEAYKRTFTPIREAMLTVPDDPTPGDDDMFLRGFTTALVHARSVAIDAVPADSPATTSTTVIRTTLARFVQGLDDLACAVL